MTIKVTKLFVCPLCGYEFGRSELGVNTHLRMHVRDKSLPADELFATRLAVTGRKYVDKESIETRVPEGHK